MKILANKMESSMRIIKSNTHIIFMEKKMQSRA